MADDEHGAVIVGDHFLEQIERLEVEVVGRLVEHQQVGAAGELAGEQQARALAARQGADLGVDKAGIEQELLEIALDVLLVPAHLDPVAAVGEDVANLLVRIEQPALLVDHDPLQRLGAGDRPSSGASSPVSSLSKVVLPVPFAPTTPIRSPRWMRGVKSLTMAALAEALGDPVGVDHHPGLDVVIGEAEPGRAGRAEHGRARGAHLVQLGEPALVAPAPGGDSALQPVQFELQLGVELFRGARFLGIDLLGPRLEAAEPDLGAAQAAAVEPQGRPGQALEEGAIVADRDEGAGVAAEPILQPFDRRRDRDGWSARRAAAHRDPAPARARSPRGAVRPRRSRRRTIEVDSDLVGDRIDRMCRARRRPARTREAWRKRRRPDPARAGRPWCRAGWCGGPRRSRSGRPGISSRVVLPAPLRPISASRSRSPTNRSSPRNSQPAPWTRPRFS